MALPDPVLEAVSQRLSGFIGDQAVASAELGAEAVAFTAAGGDAVSGGKRLRARFCVAGWQAVAQRSDPDAGADDAVVAAAAALEIFHAAALVHDDLVDHSDTRRGRPSAHRRLEAGHGAAGWAGDAARYGRSAAILLGDLLVAWSDDLLEEGLRSSAHAAAARAVYALMRREVTIGQYLDVTEEAAFATAPEAEQPARALRIASLKSARYSVQHPLLLGAALAGADPAQSTALSRFGHPLGLAFQLRDDVLGVFGDAAVTGKPSGDDLREGKRTLLIAYAREAMSPSARLLLDELLGDPTLEQPQITALQQTIVDTGALQRVEEMIAQCTAEAESALDDAPLAPTALAVLRDLGRAATVRTA